MRTRLNSVGPPEQKKVHEVIAIGYLGTVELALRAVPTIVLNGHLEPRPVDPGEDPLVCLLRP